MHQPAPFRALQRRALGRLSSRGFPGYLIPRGSPSQVTLPTEALSACRLMEISWSSIISGASIGNMLFHQTCPPIVPRYTCTAKLALVGWAIPKVTGATHLCLVSEPRSLGFEFVLQVKQSSKRKGVASSFDFLTKSRLQSSPNKASSAKAGLDLRLSNLQMQMV